MQELAQPDPALLLPLRPGSKCCEAEGYACTKDSQCCDGLICRDPDLADGVNLKGCFVGGELNPGAQCLDNAECASGSCNFGICCDPANLCVADPYDPASAECCDQQCTDEGCCSFANACFGLNGSQCCDGYLEYCQYDLPSGDYYCTFPI